MRTSLLSLASMATKTIGSWVSLNAKIKETYDEDKLRAMIDEELKREHPRAEFVRRIHARLNKVRGGRERAALSLMALTPRGRRKLKPW